MPANFTGSLAISGSLLLTGSITTTGGITISGSIASASFAATASSADNFVVRQNLTGSNILATGAITAQTLVVQTVTSSIVYSSGSNIFGNQLTDTQRFTGSMFITGSTLNVNGGSICATQNMCIGGMGIVASCLGVGTAVPYNKLTVVCCNNSTSDNVVMSVRNDSSCANTWNKIGFLGTTTGGDQFFGKIGFYQECHVYPYNYSSFTIETLNNLTGGLTERLRIDRNGVSCFSNTVCATTSAALGSITSYSYGAIRGYIGDVDGDCNIQVRAECGFYLKTGGNNLRFIMGPSGAATFCSSVNATKAYIIPTGGAGSGSDGILNIQTVSTTLGATDELGILLKNNGTNGYYSQIGFGYAESRVAAVIAGVITSGGGATNSALIFATRPTTIGTDSPIERMRITSGGNIGIGSSPTSYSITSPYVNIKNTVNNSELIFATKGSTQLGAFDGNVITSAGTTANLLIASDGGCIAFGKYVNGYTSYCETMRITSGGNVGIGACSPEGLLTIKGISCQPLNSGTTANSLLQIVGSLNNELNIGLNCVSGCYGAYLQVNDNNLAVNYPLNLQPNGGQVSIGTYSTSTEANLFLGAQGTVEGGQLVLQKGTSCSCATHLDNYQNIFRILSGTDTTSNAQHFMLDHTTLNACFYGCVVAPNFSFIPTTISNSTSTIFAAGNQNSIKYFCGSLNCTEKFGINGGTYNYGFYFVQVNITGTGRGFGIYAYNNTAANGGFTLVSTAGGICFSTVYNAGNAISIAFDGSNRGPFISNNIANGATIYTHVLGGI